MASCQPVVATSNYPIQYPANVAQPIGPQFVPTAIPVMPAIPVPIAIPGIPVITATPVHGYAVPYMTTQQVYTGVYNARNDPNCHAYKPCCACPPSLLSMATGQLFLEIICIICGFITLLLSPLGLLQVFSGACGVIVSSVIVCNCKCCAANGEIIAFLVVNCITTILSVVDVIVYGTGEWWLIMVGAMIIGIFRGSCIVVAGLSICQVDKALTAHQYQQGQAMSGVQMAQMA